VIPIAPAALFGGLHIAEATPPILACVTYLMLYGHRARTLARDGRPVPRWRAVSFASGVITMTAVQLPPFDTLADRLLAAHMVQHIVIGDICSLLIALGLTGPILAPLLHIRVTRPLRVLVHPVVALTVWAVNLYLWHLPGAYQLAVRVDIVHALEHFCMLWAGTLLWLALLGPLPKPKWFTGWGKLGYIIAVRFTGGLLGNVLVWSGTVFYPVYDASDAARGLNPLTDQSLAGAAMMVEQSVLTILMLGWLFFQFAAQDEERQALLDLARRQGVPLSEDRALRAAQAGAGERLRERILSGGTEAPDGQARPGSHQPDDRDHADEHYHAPQGIGR
jgi:cytochrome c oxidase assembly factor CtaG